MSRCPLPHENPTVSQSTAPSMGWAPQGTDPVPRLPIDHRFDAQERSRLPTIEPRMRPPRHAPPTGRCRSRPARCPQGAQARKNPHDAHSHRPPAARRVVHPRASATRPGGKAPLDRPGGPGQGRPATAAAAARKLPPFRRTEALGERAQRAPGVPRQAQMAAAARPASNSQKPQPKELVALREARLGSVTRQIRPAPITCIDHAS